jgi:hypothetical protein
MDHHPLLRLYFGGLNSFQHRVSVWSVSCCVNFAPGLFDHHLLLINRPLRSIVRCMLHEIVTDHCYFKWLSGAVILHEFHSKRTRLQLFLFRSVSVESYAIREQIRPRIYGIDMSSIMANTSNAHASVTNSYLQLEICTPSVPWAKIHVGTWVPQNPKYCRARNSYF